MTRPHERSTSLPDLDDAIDRAAAADGTTVSAWTSETAARRLLLDAGRGALAEWENERGPLTADEIAEGIDRARRLLDRSATSR